MDEPEFMRHIIDAIDDRIANPQDLQVSDTPVPRQRHRSRFSAVSPADNSDSLPRFPSGVCDDDEAERVANRAFRGNGKQPPAKKRRVDRGDNAESGSSSDGKKPMKTSRFFDDSARGVGMNIIDFMDGEDKMEKMMQYRMVESKKMDLLRADVLEPDDNEKEIVERLVDEVRPVGALVLARAVIPPVFTTAEDREHEHAAVRESKCYLCTISEANMPDYIADKQRNTETRYSAYSRMMVNDLKYCGTKMEVELMQINADIFNGEIRRLASLGKKNCHPVTVSEVNEHLNRHDFSNPKREVVQSMIEAQNLRDKYKRVIEGITADGSHILRAAHTKLYVTAAREYHYFSREYRRICDEVNVNILGEEPITGRPLHGSGHGGGGNNGSRHLALRNITGASMPKTMK